MYRIGPYSIDSFATLAPMAGVTDSCFRKLCRHFGAGLATTEMITSQQHLWHTRKSATRLDFSSDDEPRCVQIAGAEPALMAAAARQAEAMGAQIIDINMGCPAKKVCRKAAGSALLRDEATVAAILEAVVAAVQIPVSLKIRTGWDLHHRNAVTIARLAEKTGIQSLAVHGRTRACRYDSPVEYATIADVVKAVSIPVIANGDIETPEKAREVLDMTGADAVMLGRAALGRPWFFAEVDHFLRTGEHLPPPDEHTVLETLQAHLDAIYALYGEKAGSKIARKHFGWYIDKLPLSGFSDRYGRADLDRIKQAFYGLESARSQSMMVSRLFELSAGIRVA